MLSLLSVLLLLSELSNFLSSSAAGASRFKELSPDDGSAAPKATGVVVSALRAACTCAPTSRFWAFAASGHKTSSMLRKRAAISLWDTVSSVKVYVLPETAATHCTALQALPHCLT